MLSISVTKLIQGTDPLKKMLQRIPTAFTQAKTGDTTGNLFNEINQIAYSLYQIKYITLKIYNNIMNSR